jgi:hypothetical protein
MSPDIENIQNNGTENTPVDNSAQDTPSANKRRYNTKQEIDRLAQDVYHKFHRGLVYSDLIARGKASHKSQAQSTLKHYAREGTLFTLDDKKPQQYYPASIQDAVIQDKKTIPVDPTGVRLQGAALELALQHQAATSFMETLVLAQLVPLCIHKIQLQLKVPTEVYDELRLPCGKINKQKKFEENVGHAKVTYTVSKTGTINVAVACSEAPFLIQTEDSQTALMCVLGQVYDRLAVYINDRKGKFLPPLLSWYFTGCDLNKDVPIVNMLHLTGLKIQLVYVDKVLRVYVKDIQGKSLGRIEDSFSKMLQLSEATKKVLRPCGEVEDKIEYIISWIKKQEKGSEHSNKSSNDSVENNSTDKAEPQ